MEPVFGRHQAETGPNRDLVGRLLKFNGRVPLKAQTEEPRGTGQFNGPLLDVVIAGPTLKPVRVYREFNDYCDPPQEHLGKPIPYADFVPDIAKAAIPCLREMIAEAESRVC